MLQTGTGDQPASAKCKAVCQRAAVLSSHGAALPLTVQDVATFQVYTVLSSQLQLSRGIKQPGPMKLSIFLNAID